MGSDIPAGFRPYSEPSPFIDRVGPLYQRQEGQELVFGLRVIAHHCNRRGFAHGGVIMSRKTNSLPISEREYGHHRAR